MIFPRPSVKCGKCKEETPCPCECHEKNLANGKHYEIYVEQYELKARPVKDLEHFRD